MIGVFVDVSLDDEQTLRMVCPGLVAWAGFDE
jgi:hypothetical protein